ncbi:MBL fold metallo-hydrolase [Dehalococcoidia bacterium]|nr:MBL fold metallo-hydrolase [Dehalococcoidia bacterium]
MTEIFRDGIEIRKINTGPYDNNTYVVVCPKTQESVIVDTPAEPEKIIAAAADTKVKAILMTHCHMDHVLGHEEVRASIDAPVWVHESEASQLPTPPEHFFEDGGQITFGTITLNTLHVPGHTTGGTSLLWGTHLFSGDTLFPNGPGRTTTPANFKQLVRSLEDRIFVLPDNVTVYPGHGANTVLGREKDQYLQFKLRAHAADICGDVLWVED